MDRVRTAGDEPSTIQKLNPQDHFISVLGSSDQSAPSTISSVTEGVFFLRGRSPSLNPHRVDNFDLVYYPRQPLFNIRQFYERHKTAATVMARVNARSLINFTAPLPPGLIQNRRLFETRCLLFSMD